MKLLTWLFGSLLSLGCLAGPCDLIQTLAKKKVQYIFNKDETCQVTFKSQGSNISLLFHSCSQGVVTDGFEMGETFYMTNVKYSDVGGCLLITDDELFKYIYIQEVTVGRAKMDMGVSSRQDLELTLKKIEAKNASRKDRFLPKEEYLSY